MTKGILILFFLFIIGQAVMTQQTMVVFRDQMQSQLEDIAFRSSVYRVEEQSYQLDSEYFLYLLQMQMENWKKVTYSLKSSEEKRYVTQLFVQCNVRFFLTNQMLFHVEVTTF